MASWSHLAKFRRSIKNERHDPAKSGVQISIPHKDAIAIEPPKKVIKALYDYRATGDPAVYLSFSAGDFLHVVSRENDEDWYEACNPLLGSRGLVPVRYFEGVGKTVRDSGSSATSASATHDSGYAEGATPRSVGNPGANGSDVPPLPLQAMMSQLGHRSSKSISKAMGGVFGVVVYDFHAERPDELDAKEGEAIIVIAQSNPEWFVAKPITRLGGPGLIPVSFIEIRDMSTGKAVEDPVAAVAKAGIPRVEDWKKMAAEYKNTSIPLGTVSSSSQPQNLTQNMDRMSLSTTQSAHRRTTSSYHQQHQNLPAPERASVPKYVYADDKFHFVVESRLSNGTHWDLSRVYEDFYELQINLINAFPEEAGQTQGKPRILPYMPGPVQYVTDSISEGRRANLDEYLRDLLALPEHITKSYLVKSFFVPRQGDHEVDPKSEGMENHSVPLRGANRYSTTSHQSQQNAAGQQPPSTQGQVPEQAAAYGQTSNGAQYAHRPQMSTNNASHFRSPSEFGQTPSAPGLVPPQMSRQATSASAATSTSSTAPVKVKAWFDRDTCVVIRMPPRGQFTFEELHRKIVERRQLEYKGQDQHGDELDIEYRDEQDGEYYRLEGQEDMDIAVERNEKLTLAVRAAGS